MVLATLVSVRRAGRSFLSHYAVYQQKRLWEAISVLVAWTSGGEEEDRTPDLVIANDALYQLSYFPVLQGSHNNTMVIERNKSSCRVFMITILLDISSVSL